MTQRLLGLITAELGKHIKRFIKQDDLRHAAKYSLFERPVQAVLYCVEIELLRAGDCPMAGVRRMLS